MVEVPLPWERLLWSGRPTRLMPHLAFRHERYMLTDLRLARVRGTAVTELALHDIGEVHRTSSSLERWLGLSTIHARARDPRRGALTLHSIRRGPQLAALLELLSGDPRTAIDLDAARAGIEWEPRVAPPSPGGEAVAGIVVVFVAIMAVAVGLHGRAAPVAYPADDAIYPGGLKNDRETIMRFMQGQVLPWARVALAPIKGGSDRITCETCHGAHPEWRDWQMPSVAALPQPDLREQGWEVFGGTLDAQVRNAIYGYIAESDKQEKAAYMREVVMPGMARLLHRPPYDFTKPYDYNRARMAFGCYHCHRVK